MIRRSAPLELIAAGRRPIVLRVVERRDQIVLEQWERPHRGDLIAGLSVAIVLVPQALAYAEIAGLPAYIGLYAAALPPLAAAAVASSRYLQTGPTAMTALLTLGGLSAVADPGSPEYVKLAVLLALVVGVMRVGLGLLRGGILAYMMSSPVLIGFTAAAAILIIASQIPTTLGVATDGSILAAAARALRDPGTWSWLAIAVTFVTIAVVLAGRRLHRLFPGMLVAVVAGVAFSELTGFDGFVVGTVPSGLPPLSLSFPLRSVWSLLLPGAVIAVAGFAEVAAISRTFATQDRERWDSNREFVSQGVANLVAAVSGGFPVGGSFSRSSVARLAGARSQWTGAVTGVAVLAFLPLAGVIEALPRAVLAGIVIVSVVRLVRITAMARLVAKTWGQSSVAWGTFIATLSLAPRIELGVVIGVLLAAAVHLRRETKIRVTTYLENGALVLRPSGVLFYGSIARLDEALGQELAANPSATSLIVDLGGLGRIDYTGALALKQFLDDAEAAGLNVGVRDIPKHAEGTLYRSWGDDLTHLQWEN